MAEEIIQSVKNVLPHLTEEIINKIVERLVTDLGCSTISDLALVRDEDLGNIVKPILVRKLIKAWEQKKPEEAERTPSSPQPSTSSSSSPSRAYLYVNRQTNLSNLVATVNTDPSWPHRFNVPIDKLTRPTLNTLEKGDRLIGRMRKELIHRIVEAVRDICVNPIRRQFAIIAKKVHDTFPNAIADSIDGTVVGSGFETLINQLVNRNENVARTSNPLKQVHNVASTETVTTESPSSNRMDQYGCINWQPVVGDRENQIEKKKKMMRSGGLLPEQNIISADITYTYALQREHVNNGIDMSTIVFEWPWLCSEVGLSCHFSLLTGISIKAEMLSSFQRKGGRILQYCQEAVTKPKAKARCKVIASNLETARIVTGSDRPTLIAVLLMLLAVFDEKEGCIFILAHEHCTAEEASRLKLPRTPVIIACGESILSGNKFMLAVDGVVIIDHITSILSGLTTLFASFYCFNIQYPEQGNATLEFIQRGFVGINPDKGKKTGQDKRQKIAHTHSKVLSFITAIADFEWMK